jgi:IstB-like ATP binding protein
MYHALVEQMQMPDMTTLSFQERLGLLVDCELTEREDRRLTTRLRQATLRQAACLEDLDYRQPRGLGKALMTT